MNSEIAAAIQQLIEGGADAGVIGRLLKGMAAREREIIETVRSTQAESIAVHRFEDHAPARSKAAERTARWRAKRHAVTSPSVTETVTSDVTVTSPTVTLARVEDNSLPLENLAEGKKEERKKRARRHVWPDDYREQFWSAWPDKRGRKPAIACLERIHRADAEPFSPIVAGVDAYRRAKPPDWPWKNATTFLNGEHWKDDHSQIAGHLGGRTPAGGGRRETVGSVLATAVAGYAAERGIDLGPEAGGPAGTGADRWDARFGFDADRGDGAGAGAGFAARADGRGGGIAGVLLDLERGRDFAEGEAVGVGGDAGGRAAVGAEGGGAPLAPRQAESADLFLPFSGGDPEGGGTGGRRCAGSDRDDGPAAGREGGGADQRGREGAGRREDAGLGGRDAPAGRFDEHAAAGAALAAGRW